MKYTSYYFILEIDFFSNYKLLTLKNAIIYYKLKEGLYMSTTATLITIAAIIWTLHTIKNSLEKHASK